MAGISLNGKITDEHGDFAKYSSDEDKEWLAQKIEESDVLVVGKKTYEAHLKNGQRKKPLIIFTRSIKGLKIDEEKNTEAYFFHDKKEDLLNLLDLLQYDIVTILGGAEIYHWFLEQKLVTDIHLTVEPVIFSKGKPLLTGNFLNEQKSWLLKESKTLNDQGTLLLHYQTI